MGEVKTLGDTVRQPHSAFYVLLYRLWNYGKDCAPRGLACKELVDCSYVLPPRVRFVCFDHRKLKLDYVKQEFLWYIRGNRKDVSIKHIAKMWDGLINTDGTINSNYGYYIFNREDRPMSNFERVIATLLDDPDSRRASIQILDNDHLNSDTKDYPCTCYINFHIRRNELNMYVRMRSQDAIFGMGNDAPCFSFVHELMWAELRRHEKFKDLELGPYYHSADSYHVYERHYDMVEKILREPLVTVDYHEACPIMNGPSMLNDLSITSHYLGKEDLSKSFDHLHPFLKWILTRDDPKTLLIEEEINDNKGAQSPT